MAQNKVSGSGNRTRAKNQERAKMMKRLGIERTTGRCAVCYRIITCESRISRYTHVCNGL